MDPWCPARLQRGGQGVTCPPQMVPSPPSVAESGKLHTRTLLKIVPAATKTLSSCSEQNSRAEYSR